MSDIWKEEAEERVTILLDQIKRFKSEIKSREEEVTRLCKKYGISVILD